MWRITWYVLPWNVGMQLYIHRFVYMTYYCNMRILCSSFIWAISVVIVHSCWQLHMFHVSLKILGSFVGMARFFCDFLASTFIFISMFKLTMWKSIGKSGSATSRLSLLKECPNPWQRKSWRVMGFSCWYNKNRPMFYMFYMYLYVLRFGGFNMLKLKLTLQ